MLQPILAAMPEEAITFKDIIYTVVGVLWLVYLGMDIWKNAKGKDKATLADLEAAKRHAWDAHTALESELTELAKDLKEEKAERTRIQRGVDAQLGELRANCTTLLEACKEQRASIEAVRKEFDSKLGSVHRRMDQIPHP